jgi:hypothetical protein
MLRVESKTGTIEINASQMFIAHTGEWIWCRWPDTGEAEYIAVCHQAFSPETLKKGAVDGSDP